MAMGLLHMVLIKARPDADEATIDLIFKDLRKIKSIVPGIGAIIAGRSNSPEQMERGYTHGFTIEMESYEILKQYQEHPDHRAVGARLVAVTEGGLDGILVLDIGFDQK
jgi:Stress responsive A/B Barrel Domain